MPDSVRWCGHQCLLDTWTQCYQNLKAQLLTSCSPPCRHLIQPCGGLRFSMVLLYAQHSHTILSLHNWSHWRTQPMLWDFYLCLYFTALKFDTSTVSSLWSTKKYRHLHLKFWHDIFHSTFYNLYNSSSILEDWLYLIEMSVIWDRAKLGVSLMRTEHQEHDCSFSQSYGTMSHIALHSFYFTVH